MSKEITKEQWAESSGFLEKIKELNKEFRAEYGRVRRAYTETYGCQQNVNDTERIRGMLNEAGFDFTDDVNEADLVIYNTCAIRENAEQRVFGRLGILKHIKEKKPNMLVGLCGCMVQQPHITEKIKKVHNHVNLIFGTHNVWRMPELLYTAMKNKTQIIDIADSEGTICEEVPILRDKSEKAWVSVMYGCNNFCTYCIVPYVRGRERSRRPEMILAEIRNLAKSGVTEISLLGQNVNSYGKDLDEDIDFADLLYKVNEIEGIKRIRFMTSHPKDLSDKLIYAIRDCDKVCKQLHLPLQCGSDRVLKEMNRHYTSTQYRSIIDKLKKEIPQITITTDIIVGFPTETNEDFEETVKMLQYVRYDSIFSFIYSKREGTPAAKLDFVLTDKEIHENFDRLLAIQNQICYEKNLEYKDREELVLVEEVSTADSNILCGRTDGGKLVSFSGSSDLIGQYVRVKITNPKQFSLEGEIIR